MTIYPGDSERVRKFKRRLAATSGIVIPTKVVPGHQPKGHQDYRTGLWIRCRICGSKFGSKCNVREHFVACVKENGNPLGLRYTDYDTIPADKVSRKRQVITGRRMGKKL